MDMADSNTDMVDNNKATHPGPILLKSLQRKESQTQTLVCQIQILAFQTQTA
jgi:hypothetical protein